MPTTVRGISVLEYVVPPFHGGSSALENVPPPARLGFSVLEAVGPVPDPPTITSVGTHADRLTVAFTPGSDHGYAITSFTVTASPGGVTATGSASPIDIFLAPGAYTVTVHATNTYGDSAESAPASGTVAIPPVPTTPSPDAWASVYENVGVMGLAVPDALGETYQAVNTDQPYPHIWYVFPDHVSLGDEVHVVGTGFGASQDLYLAGLTLGAQVPVILSWGTLAAGVNAYASGREINPSNDTADPEHDRIVFTVPSTAQSSNVRVSTEEVTVTPPPPPPLHVTARAAQVFEETIASGAPAARAAQVFEEVVVQSYNVPLNVAQVFEEAIVKGAPAAQAAQVFEETIASSAPAARVAQTFVEVIVQ